MIKSTPTSGSFKNLPTCSSISLFSGWIIPVTSVVVPPQPRLVFWEKVMTLPFSITLSIVTPCLFNSSLASLSIGILWKIGPSLSGRMFSFSQSICNVLTPSPFTSGWSRLTTPANFPPIKVPRNKYPRNSSSITTNGESFFAFLKPIIKSFGVFK